MCFLNLTSLFHDVGMSSLCVEGSKGYGGAFDSSSWPTFQDILRHKQIFNFRHECLSASLYMLLPSVVMVGFELTACAV